MRRFLLLAAVAVVLSACGKGAPSFVGTWNGVNGLSVTFGEDGSFSQKGQKRFVGTWKLTEGKAVATVGQVDGKSIEDYAKAVVKQRGLSTSKAFADDLRKVLSHIEYDMSKNGATITQEVPGMIDAVYTRAKS